MKSDSPEFKTVTAFQAEWARRQGFALNPSRTGLSRVEDALLLTLDPETRQQLEMGAGKELSRMHSLRSSTALALNVFLPWKQDPTGIAGRLGGAESCTGLGFEVQYPIGVRSRNSPHLDVLLHTLPRPIAVESKFLEPYDDPEPRSMAAAYLETDDLWDGLPRIRKLAEEIAFDPQTFERLHAAQLVKHVLGLSRRYGPLGFRLVYLWYRVSGLAAEIHGQEVARFVEAIGDDVEFMSLTYQGLYDELRELPEPVPGYLLYLGDRYFSSRTQDRARVRPA